MLVSGVIALGSVDDEPHPNTNKATSERRIHRTYLRIDGYGNLSAIMHI
jgi:hypothetical protein